MLRGYTIVVVVIAVQSCGECMASSGQEWGGMEGWAALACNGTVVVTSTQPGCGYFGNRVLRSSGAHICRKRTAESVHAG